MSKYTAMDQYGYATCNHPVDHQAYTAWVKSKEKVQPEMVMDRESFFSLIHMAECAGEVVDLFKKQFLGKKLSGQVFITALSALRFAVRNLDDAFFTDSLRAPEKIDVNLRLYHAALGKFGEAAELLSAIGKQAETGVLDVVNVKEELGDDQFYTAMAIDAVQLELFQVLDSNHDKLEIRYPTGFTVEASDSRDVVKERAALEGQPFTPDAESSFTGTPGMERVGSSLRPIRGCGQTLGDIIADAQDKIG